MARSRRTDWRRKGPLLGVNRTKSPRARIDEIDPDVWSGRASQEVFVEVTVSGLASMYPASDWSALWLRATMDISARATSLADRPHWAIRVTSARTRREDRSSISSHPLADLGGLETSGYIIASSSRSRRSSRLGIGLVGHPRLETPATGKNAPGDAGQLVGKRDREDVVVQPLLGRLEPGLEPVALPALGLDQHNPRRLDEQDAQVAIATLRYLAEDGAIPSRDLLGDEPQPSGEVAAFCERIAIANGSHHRAGDDRPDPRHAHQPLAQPIIPIRRKEPFDDPAYLFELKLDGFRGIADTIKGRVLSKNGNRMKRFERLLEGLPAGFVFDGEI